MIKTKFDINVKEAYELALKYDEYSLKQKMTIYVALKAVLMFNLYAKPSQIDKPTTKAAKELCKEF